MGHAFVGAITNGVSMLRRTARFLFGLSCGSALGLVLAGAWVGVDLARHRGPGTDRVLVAGRDVTLAGGRRVAVEQEARTLLQTCRGACDDVELDAGGHPQAVRVDGVDGRTVVRRQAGLFTSGGGHVWAVAGQPRLQIGSGRP
jgi:hypothetical protein